MSFRDMVAKDNVNVFMNLDEFAEKHIIEYDGKTYDGEDGEGITCVISQLKQQDRNIYKTDYVKGVYLVTSVFHCPLEALNGKVPKKGTKIRISDGDFMQDYYVGQSGCDLGMIRLELEALDD